MLEAIYTYNLEIFSEFHLGYANITTPELDIKHEVKAVQNVSLERFAQNILFFKFVFFFFSGSYSLNGPA